MPSVQRTTSARIPTHDGTFQLIHYSNDRDDKEHLALVMGDVSGCDGVLVRVHSECMTGDVFGSLRCDCGEQLQLAMSAIAREGRGVVVYLRQEGRGIGLAQKLRAYNLQDKGFDTVEANLLLGHQADEREYWAAVGIVNDLGIRSIRLLTNNPAKIEHLRDAGVAVAERVALVPRVHADNAAYLETKVRRMRHLLALPTTAPPTIEGTSLSRDLSERIDLLHHRALAYATERGRPYVTLSYAQSVDGSIAARRGEQLAISGPDATTLTHSLRAVHDGILVGIGTVLADNPRLTTRLVAGSNPQPIVLDSRLRFPPGAHLLQHPKGVWIAAAAPTASAAKSFPEGVRLLEIGADPKGMVDLPALLDRLGAMGIRSLMVEGGARVLASFFRQRLVNEVVITLAPLLVGGLHALQQGGNDYPVAPAAMARLTNVEYMQAGMDLVVWGEPIWDGT